MEEPISSDRERDEHSTRSADRWRYVFSLFVILGVSGLLPWNLFITAHQYFYDKFGAANSTSGEYFQQTFENYFVLTGSLFAFAGNVLNVCLTRKLTGDGRIIVGHCLVVGSLIPTFIFSFLDTSQWIDEFFVLTLLLIVVGQIGCSGLICGAAAGLAVLFAPGYTKGFITGQALCGVLTSVISIISLAAVGPVTGGVGAGAVYFALAIACSLFSLLAYLPSRYNTFFHGSMLTLVFLVTLSCFPALTSKVVTSSDNASWRKYFVPVVCFLNVNLFDFVGRLLSSIVYWPKRGSRMLLTVVCLLRICFIPLFLACNVDTEQRRVPTVFRSDWMFGMLACLLGFTNGYLCNLLCVYLPRGFDADLKETAGASISLYINLGVLAGSCLSFAVVLLA